MDGIADLVKTLVYYVRFTVEQFNDMLLLREVGSKTVTDELLMRSAKVPLLYT